jgi:hypothetical protein
MSVPLQLKASIPKKNHLDDAAKMIPKPLVLV